MFHYLVHTNIMECAFYIELVTKTQYTICFHFLLISSSVNIKACLLLLRKIKEKRRDVMLFIIP